eukprot:1176873-Prorocentrum_minimum.AAC.8
MERVVKRLSRTCPLNVASATLQPLSTAVGLASTSTIVVGHAGRASPKGNRPSRRRATCELPGWILLQIHDLKETIEQQKKEREKITEVLAKDHQAADGRLTVAVEVETKVCSSDHK